MKDKADFVKAFADSVHSLAPFPRGSDRSVAIRLKITETEDVLRRERSTAQTIAAFLQRAKQKAGDEVARNTRNKVPTRTAEFFQDVYEELARRERVRIKEMPDDTFQVEISVTAPDVELPQVVKPGFYSFKAAQQWIDSDQGNTLIAAVIAKYEKS